MKRREAVYSWTTLWYLYETWERCMVAYIHVQSFKSCNKEVQVSVVPISHTKLVMSPIYDIGMKISHPTSLWHMWQRYQKFVLKNVLPHLIPVCDVGSEMLYMGIWYSTLYDNGIKVLSMKIGYLTFLHRWGSTFLRTNFWYLCHICQRDVGWLIFIPIS
jgi:hypothetical protein